MSRDKKPNAENGGVSTKKEIKKEMLDIVLHAISVFSQIGKTKEVDEILSLKIEAAISDLKTISKILRSNKI